MSTPRAAEGLEGSSRTDSSAGELAVFLDRHRSALAARLEAEAGVPDAADLLLGLQRALEGAGSEMTPPAERHGLRRLAEGAGLRRVVAEVTAVRDVVLERWAREQGLEPAGRGLRLLNRIVDEAVAAAAERYVAHRDRTLEALDRVSTVAFASRRVDDLLQGLLQAIVEPTAAVDTASILLREGDSLVVRAAVGLAEDARGRLRIPIGTGFAGRIAAESRPRLLVDEQIHEEAHHPVLEARGLRALYGVPLQSDGQVLGVAQIGSSSMAGFSDQDRRLFEAMCARATAAIRQHLLQEAYANQIRELETVLQSIPDPVFVADERGVHHANRAALELFGVDSLEQLTRSSLSLSEIVNARHADTGAPLAPDERPVARALRGETTTGEMIVQHLRTGQDVILQCAVAPVASGSAIVGAVAACTDITQRKRDEAQRDRLYREAKQAVADRQHVLAVVSHDLRNPLNTILLAAETLREEGMPPAVRGKGLAMITRAARRMNEMISDLLDVNSIEGGRLALDPSPLDPVSVVDEAIDLLAPQALSRSVELRKQVAGSLPLVRGDRRRLVQALANLLSNALKVSAEGPVRVTLAREGAEVVFAVIDRGPGISADVRDRIFEPYWRSEQATYKGTGLGLAIVRGIVEGHGGRVWIESELGQGATFLFTIPMA